jgi:Flp pilus assembly protein TadD
MKRVAILTLIALLPCSATMWAQSLRVSYVEGEVAMRSGSSWVGLATGDSVATDASVRLGTAALAELTMAGSTLVLSQPGTYSIRDLLASRTSVSSPGVVKVISGSLSRLFRAPQSNQTVVLGARGAEESSQGDLQWMESGASGYLQAGQNLIASGEYERAIAQLRQALDAASDEELPEVRYTLAFAYDLSGDTLNALKQVEGIEPAPSDAWAKDFILLEAKLLVDSFAFPQAVELLTAKGAGLSTDAGLAPNYFFLLGLAYRGAGDAANAKRSLSQVLTLAKDSDLAGSANQLLQSL